MSKPLKFQKKSDTATLPTKGSAFSAGYDLYIDTIKVVDDFGYMVYYGVAVEIPEGYVGLLVERSSTHKMGISIANKIGIIDSDYRGELMSPVKKVADEGSFAIGDRIAQLVIVPCFNGTPTEVESLTSTDRGDGGFGSTGQ